MTGDEARDFVEKLAEWKGETSGRMMEELITDARDLINPIRTPRAVFVFPNGNVAVTDDRGQQISALQGLFSDKALRDRILEAADEKTEFNGWTP